MKLKLPLLLSTLLLSITLSAQWVQRASFPGVARAKSSAFTIGNKIYVMGGVDNLSTILKDFWEYDIATNTWTHKSDFPGPERYGAVAFVINNKGFISTGGNDFGFLDDIWQFDPATDNWTQRTGMPVGSAQHENQRREAYSFVIGNKAYIGGGEGFVFAPNSTNNIAFTDLWEYNPSGSTWTSKANIPDFGRNMSIAASINNKGYVGLGCDVDQTINRKSFWEYDPISDSWTAKSDFPTLFTVDASSFVLDSALYLVGGVNLNPVGLSNQFYKYDPVADAWTQLATYNGGSIAGEFAISTGSTAFVGSGYTGSIIPRNDLWELSVSTGMNENIFTPENIAVVYPSPANEMISINSRKDISGIEILDMTGKIVLKEVNTFKNIDIQNLNPGIYNVKLTFKDGSTSGIRFIKSIH